MRKIIAWAVVILTAVLLSFTVIKLVGGLEVITLSASGDYIISLADNTIYVDEGDVFSLDIEQKNKDDRTQITVDIKNQEGKDVLVYKQDEGKCYALEAGVSRIIVKTTNKHYATLCIDVFVGNGEQETPFYLARAEQLASIGTNEGKYADYQLDDCYKLVSDIDVSTVYNGYWKPLGDFAGILDGNGFAISNLTISRTDFMVQNEGEYAEFTNAGLFNTILNTGYVYNLKFDNVKAIGDYATLGTVAGINFGVVERVEVRSLNFNSNGDYIGGIAGVNDNIELDGAVYSRNTGLIDRCAVNLVFGDANGISGTIGGVVGLNEGSTVKYSYSVGQVYLSDGSVFGGVIGCNSFATYLTTDLTYTSIFGSARIKDCYSAVCVFVAGLSNINNNVIGGVIGINNDAMDLVDSERLYINKIIGCYYDTENLNTKEIYITKDFDGIGIDQIYENGINTEIEREEGKYFVCGYQSIKMKLANYYYSHLRTDVIYNMQGKFIEEQTVEIMWDFEHIWDIQALINNGYPILRYEKIIDMDDDFSYRKEIKVEVYNLHLSEWLAGIDDEYSNLATIKVYNIKNELILSTTSSCDLPIYSDAKIYLQSKNVLQVYRGKSLVYKIIGSQDSESYSIIGWMDNNDNEKWYDTPIICNSDKTLRLKLSEVIITSRVVFEYNNATTKGVTSKIVQYGKEYGTLPTPTRIGYEFAGWYLENNFLTYVDNNSIVSTTHNQHFLYAKWVKNKGDISVTTVRIYLNANGGTVSPTYIDREVGGKYGTLPTPEKTRCEFDGWYSNQLLTNLVTSSTILVSNSMHMLYAKWIDHSVEDPEADYVTVIFDANGGVGSMGVQIIEYNTPTTLKANLFSKTGCEFEGWSLSPNSTVVYKNYEIVTFDKTTEKYLTLYAVWKDKGIDYPDVNYITVTFNANGGSGSMSSQIMQVGESQALKANTFTRSGYTFSCWRNISNSLTYSDKQIVSFTTNVTLYAIWSQNTTPVTESATLSYNANGGQTVSGANTSSVTVKVGTTITLKSTSIFTKDGYTCIGWSTTPTGVVQYSSGQQYTVSYNTTMYAVWKVKETPVTETATVSYNANGGSRVSGADTSSVTVTVGTKINLKSTSIFTRDGYTCTGWSTTPTGVVQYSSGQQYTVSYNTTMYAVWKANETKSYVWVTYDVNGGEGNTYDVCVEKNKTYTIASCPFTKQNYTFNGWSTSRYSSSGEYSVGEQVPLSSNLTLYAIWKEKAPSITYVTLSYNANGGNVASGADASGIQVEKDTYVTLKSTNIFTRDGYTCLGWSTYADGNVQYKSGASVKISSNTTMYAIWDKNEEAKEYVILSYNANGGSGSMNYQKVEKGSSVTVKSNGFTKSGSTFLGWSTNSSATSGQSTYAPGTTINIYSNITLYAIWSTPVTNVTLSYNANDGSGSMTSQTVVKGSEVTVKSNSFTKSGCTFLGWSTNSSATSGQSAYTPGTTINIYSNITLYAIWSTPVTNVTLSYNANGGSGSMTSQTVAKGSEVTVKSNCFTKSGSTFLGWSTNSSATTGQTSYTPGTTINIYSNITLFAIWNTPVTNVTLSYNANGGSGSMTSQTVAKGSEVTVKSNSFTKRGYTFMGWSTSSSATSGQTFYTPGTTINIYSNITLYAVWKKN